ncbi:MAG: anaerobic ribonucleoside-triphosphate reductase activating protein [Chlorobiaceae bacterium]|nr:anaerobic ribonucleoside-triphosphate reductase activating protein [Chlorobiaceae bacterium]
MLSGGIELPVGGFLPQSLVDYPGLVAAVLYTSGCNFRCPFCHNPELVLPEEFGAPPLLAFDEVYDRIARNRKLLGGVVVTGGEPTIHASLPDALRALKALGLAVKLDTNGSRPEMLELLLGEGLVDEVAMDIKAPLRIDRYGELAGIDCSPTLLARISESVLRLRGSDVNIRFRSTIVEGLHTENDVQVMRELLDGAIVFQTYRAGKTLAMPFSNRC